MHRIEYNMSTGDRTTIHQQAYKDADGNLFILDVGDTPDPGLTAITDDEALSIAEAAAADPGSD